MKISAKKLKENAILPTYGSKCAAGADLCACLEEPILIAPGKTEFIGTGIAVAIPTGYAGFVYARSGLASKRGIAPANKVGVIDSDYRGEIIVSLYNHSGEGFTVNPGDRIAQIVIAPVEAAEFELVSELEKTERGEGGFGSTGLAAGM